MHKMRNGFVLASGTCSEMICLTDWRISGERKKQSTSFKKAAYGGGELVKLTAYEEGRKHWAVSGESTTITLRFKGPKRIALGSTMVAFRPVSN
jgi:hypothetical protein